MYAEVTAWDNLVRAFRKAAKGKRGQPNVAAFEYTLEENLWAIQQELQHFTYRPGAYQSFYIHEPKRRLISAAPFRDRVVHHALCNLIEPIFERSFIFDSYANRIGKGTHRAIARCQQFSRRYGYALKCDVRQFFPSIDHAILREHLARKIDDSDVLWLVDQILASGRGVLSEQYTMVYFAGDDTFAPLRPRGLPIGNLTSQFWANVYLNGFDHFVTRELRLPYLRYVDDFVLFANDKAVLWQALWAIGERLNRLRLTYHHQAQPFPVKQGIPFLGFVIYPEKRRLLQRKGVYFQRRLRDMVCGYGKDLISLTQITPRIQGWVAHVRWGNTIGLQKAILRRAHFRKSD
jgi:RNA-directed DNA polymerase